MIKGKIRESLDLKTILSKLSEYQIYRYYLGYDFIIGRAHLSPFRAEKRPSFRISVLNNGTLGHVDFTDTEKRGNCINLVEQLYHISYAQALEKVNMDFGLGIGGTIKKDYKRMVSEYKVPDIEQSDAHIVVKVKKRFDTAELHFWNQFGGITEAELRENNVYPVKEVYLNRMRLPLYPSELVFGYLFDDKWKIYRPFAPKEKKWLTNVANATMSGLHRIRDGCHNIIITKAKKDEIVLAKFLKNVCSVQSEGIASISDETIELLKKKCNKIYLNFDSDEPGVKACKYYNQFGFMWINCPTGYVDHEGKPIKDFADLAKYHGLQTVIDYFKSKGIE